MEGGYANSAQTVTGQTIVRSTQDNPSDYLIPAILVTIFCCLPLGIVAIVKSTEVRRRIDSGDIDGAVESSKAARMWTISALICGIVILVLVIVVNFTMA
ncbi:Proline rich transmembrane protein 1B [Holothuria leucospilota]|uniref:Proline rich transmembrane protein 1B n=1 Tax=Holothuria leucospilota TaxID=206669 RepID=A0A9Q1BGA2_HOLLE|nr:Proline rich transmembrane protein 1B [Holothuria leucospilota]